MLGLARLASLGVVVAATAVTTVPAAHAAWNEPVGGASPIHADPSRDGNWGSLALVGGAPWLAWMETDGGDFQVRVARLNAAGTAWEHVGTGPSPFGQGGDSALLPNITDVGGVPWVSYQLIGTTTTEIRVKRLSSDGTTWESVGGPLNADTSRPAQPGTITVIGGVPHVAFSEEVGVAYQVRVSRLVENAMGATWEPVVPGPAQINVSATRSGFIPFLLGIGGVPHVAWNEFDGTNDEIRVSRVNAAGTAWEPVVAGPAQINRDAARVGQSASLTSIDGVPYVAWHEHDGTNLQVRVSRPNAAGTEWEELGGGPRPINRTSAGSSQGFPRVAAIGGQLFMLWTEAVGATSLTPHVSRFDAGSGTWMPVLGAIAHEPGRAGFSTSIAGFGGVPYVAFLEHDGTNLETRVARLEPEFSDSEAIETADSAFVLSKVDTHGAAYPVVFEHGPGATLGNRTPVITTAGGGTDTVFATLEGLTPSVQHSFRPAGFDGTYTIAPGATATFTTAALPPAPGLTPGGQPGPPGPAGPGGGGGPGLAPPGPQVRTTLLAAIVNTRLRVRAGRRVTLDYLSTAAGSATLDVLKGRRRIDRVTGRAKIGRNKIAWNGKRGRKKPARGKYTLRLSITGGDGQTAADRGALTLTR